MAASTGILAEFGRPDFFVLRAPLLPFEVLTTAAGGERLRALLARPEVREAVFVASPALYERLPARERDPDSESGRKVARSLIRYLARMAGRSTPFGLFAGCSVGSVGRLTELRVGPPCRHTRLDMNYVVALADALSREPGLRSVLRYAPNSSLYRVAGRARYLEVRRTDRGWSHHRAALDVPPYLDAVLTRAVGGATPGELTQALLEHDPAASQEEAAEYVGERIDQQVLVSELAPAVTGREPIHSLIERLGELPGPEAEAAAGILCEVRDELAAPLLGQLRDGESATLTELFPAPDGLCAQGSGGRYVHELVVPFVRRPIVDVARNPAGEQEGGPAPRAPAVRRSFPPGSEWLTVKLYGGPLVVDYLVRDVVGPLAEELVAENLTRLWFFVRYADPNWHLRVRFAGDPARLQADVLPRVLGAVAPQVETGRVWKVQLDTYEREVERYGGP